MGRRTAFCIFEHVYFARPDSTVFHRSVAESRRAAIVLEAKRTGGKSGVLIAGGGSPKNFMLQTEPQIQEVLGIDERGHDYFLQMTDARPDVGGLSGATPNEAVSWVRSTRPVAWHGRVLRRQHDHPAPPYGLRAPASSAPAGQAALRPARCDDGRLVTEYRAALAFRDQRADEAKGDRGGR